MRLILAVLVALWTAAAWAQGYDTMAGEPNPRDFVKRSGTGLTLIGNPLRIAGANLSWAALRQGKQPTGPEIADGLATVQAMGGSVVRVVSAGVTVGCALCLVPAPGQMNDTALKQVDALLHQARDAGLKVIIPLAGGGPCDGAAGRDPVAGTACVFAQWHGKPAAAFYTDPTIEADFRQAVTALLSHVNTETGVAYRDDPTILAWENCDGCGASQPAAALAAWTAQLGQAIHAADARHLYENGAFAGRLASAAQRPPATLLALPGVDILGDRAGATVGAPGATVDSANAANDAVNAAGRVYLIDAYGWTPKDWPQASDLENFLAGVAADRAIAGALVADLETHADQGGYMSGEPWAGAPPPLTFPGIATPAADAAETMQRARIVRRFSYRVINLVVPAFQTPDQPVLLEAKHGKLRWRGAAGSAFYSIERTGDPQANGSWTLVCSRCANDVTPTWQDPAVPAGPVWYRLYGYNANNHAGTPSDPVRNE